MSLILLSCRVLKDLFIGTGTLTKALFSPDSTNLVPLVSLHRASAHAANRVGHSVLNFINIYIELGAYGIPDVV